LREVEGPQVVYPVYVVGVRVSEAGDPFYPVGRDWDLKSVEVSMRMFLPPS
jgi:hypothetical protein